jgi:hypothetical protein
MKLKVFTIGSPVQGRKLKVNGIKQRGNETLKAGTLCAIYSYGTYRTKDGDSYYKFRFAEVGGHYEIDLLEEPDYKGRDKSSHYTHTYPSQRGGKQIDLGCPTYAPSTLEDARKAATAWAECMNSYIKNGVTIDDQISRKMQGR